MIPVLSREQMRALDAHAIERCGVPSLILMENAGRGVAEVLAQLVEPRQSVVIVCGTGNNGGDGYVVARQLHVNGLSPEVFSTSDPAKLRGDANANYGAWIGLGGTVQRAEPGREGWSSALKRADVIVDAIFGTGLSRPVEGRYVELIEAINAAPAMKVAVDIPSGVDADTGAILGVAVRADHTVTFAHLKRGLVGTKGAGCSGEIHVRHIGVPSSLHEKVGVAARVVEPDDVRQILSPRPLDTHKGKSGRVLAIAGSAGKTGAALLVTAGALRAGAGLVTACSFPETADGLQQRVLEAMTGRIDPDAIEASLDGLVDQIDVVAMGPGLGLDARARRVVDHIALGWDGVKVLDADALSHFQGRAEALRGARGKLILTPHPGELARLLGCSIAEVENDRFAVAKRAAEVTGATVLLKGPRTLVTAPDHETLVNTCSSPVLATGGTGDVLTGIVAALACVLEPFEAAWSAAYLHGASGVHWAQQTGADRGMVAHQIADNLPTVLAELSASRKAGARQPA